MDRKIMGKPSALYLWDEKHIVPFVKVDQGLVEEKDGVQLMKPLTKLQQTLKKAKENNVFGTKMRSVIKMANADGISVSVLVDFFLKRRSIMII
jgi:fructose-bisphosphate aldolase class I